MLDSFQTYFALVLNVGFNLDPGDASPTKPVTSSAKTSIAALHPSSETLRPSTSSTCVGESKKVILDPVTNLIQCRLDGRKLSDEESDPEIGTSVFATDVGETFDCQRYRRDDRARSTYQAND